LFLFFKAPGRSHQGQFRLDQKKPAATYSPLGVAAGSFESFLCWLLRLQHVTLTFRRPALPIGEEAVRKSEIEK
jgi:hypothetical protein